jgi:hypothetical protein
MDRLRDIWDTFVRNCSDAFHIFVRNFVRWLLTIGDALSQVANVVIFFGDNANESVSGRAWRLRDKYRFWGIMKVVIDKCASPFEENHCEASHKADVARAARLLRNQGL